MLILKTWVDFFTYLAQNPQSMLMIAVVVLLILFSISRMNNFMEEKGVDRAIHITRAVVSSVMYFVIVPVILFIFINILAFLNNVPLIDISFLGKWIGLTASSYLWLLNCAFQNKDVVGQEEAYTLNSAIRIIWIIIPIFIIWFQVNKKMVNRMLLIPVIALLVIVCRHKKAEETFITKDVGIETLQQIPVFGFFFKDNQSGANTDEMVSPLQRKILSGVLVMLILAGLGMGMFTTHRLIGLSLAALGLLGFVLLTPIGPYNFTTPKNKAHPYYHDADSLIHRLDSIYYEEGPESINVYQLTVEIDNAFKAKHYKLSFPDSLCGKYKQFFFDRCVNYKPKMSE
jgi:hypothetical protein